MVSWEWLVAGVVGYFLIGGLLLLWLSSRDRSLFPDADWSGFAMVVGWPLLVLTWAIFRLPESRGAVELQPNGSSPGLPPAGLAKTDLCPRGTVEVAGRQYPAIAEGREVRAGEAVEIIGRSGRTLRVRGRPL